ncbi:MAG: K+/H+ antiporter subunit F [Geminicoccaceae bacterium]|nr:K+/H+ antiporter subunit F [Geminicoccaceae bacterium]MDW8339956.1 K+/H+ antiporter subunit F [Geminicoccaceae bacterium]
MIEVALAIGFAAVGIATVFCLIRLALGPETADRVLALDTLVTNAVALIMLLGIAQATAVHFEAALLIAMMGFVGTVAFCKFVLRGDVIE